MRFLTYETEDEGAGRPGLLMADGRIVDLAEAISFAVGQGWLDVPGAVPHDLVGCIAAGEAFLAAAEALAARAQQGDLEAACRPAGACRLLAPIPRPAKNVFCVGRNYAAHVDEGNRARKVEEGLPEHPHFFTKPPTAVIGPGAPIRHDPDLTQKLDYEVELAVVIGRRGRDISQAAALDHVFGFTILNDITARDLQRRHGQWFKGKGLDASCPLGPHIVTPDELPSHDALSISLSVNGEMRQDGNTRNMIFTVPEIIASLSHGMTLEPGDIVSTGTPSGVGYAMDPPRFLGDGDVVSCRIEGIGELSNPVAGVATD